MSQFPSVSGSSALGQGPLAFLLSHFEQLGCGLAGLAVLAALASAEEPDQTAELDAARRRVEAHFRSAAPSAATPLRDRPAELRAALGAPGPAGSLPGWQLHRRPGVLAWSRPVLVCPAQHERPSLSVALEAPAGGVAAVSLSWEAPAHSDFVELSYVLERQVDEGPWVVLAELGGAERVYRDPSVGPRRAYRYRLRSRAALDPVAVRRAAARRERLELPGEAQERLSAASEAFRLPREVALIPRTVTLADPVRGQAGAAYVIVYRRDAEGWRQDGFQVELGQPIGELVEVGRRRLDFRAGAVLEAVEEREERGRLGQPVRIGVIRVRWSDGAVEEFTTRDAPPAR